MKSVLKYVIISALLLMAAGCEPYDIDLVLLSREDVSLTWKGADQIVYEPDTWQIGCNTERNEFRVHDDERANYFTVKCSARPTDEGQELTADVQWTMISSIKRFEGIRFEVKKVSADGYVWMWSRTHNIGVVLKKL